MLRKLVCAAVVVLLCTFTLLAKEYQGRVTNLDTDKHTLTVKVGDEEKTFVYTDKTTFTGKKGNDIPQEKLAGFAEKVISKKGASATIVTEETDGKEVLKDGKAVVSKVTFKGGKKKDK
jgi:hypothetical protein